MKNKVIFAFLIAIFAFLPLNIKASILVEDLKETLEEEQIDVEFENYKEDSNQVTIYLFRGDGCVHCRDFLKYLNSIADEYGYMFKLRAYEVYYNDDNKALRNRVANYFQEKITSVPYIVIGKKTFYGYSDDYKEDIFNAIKNEYDSENRFNLFAEIEKKENNSQKINILLYIIPLIGLMVIIIIVVNTVKER